MGKKRNPRNGSSRIPGPGSSGASSIPGPGGGSPSRIPKPSANLQMKATDGSSSAQPTQLSPPSKPSSIPMRGTSAIPRAGLGAAFKPANAPSNLQSNGVNNGGDSSLESDEKAGGDHFIQAVEVRVRAESQVVIEQVPCGSEENADDSVSSPASGAVFVAAHERLLSFAMESSAEGAALPAVESTLPEPAHSALPIGPSSLAEDKSQVQKAQAPEPEEAAPDALSAATEASAATSTLLLHEADWLLESQVISHCRPPPSPLHARGTNVGTRRTGPDCCGAGSTGSRQDRGQRMLPPDLVLRGRSRRREHGDAQQHRTRQRLGHAGGICSFR